TNFPLFIMVDELDRCRPDYAIELLERIKHLFDVPNVVFLLAIDGEQLLQQVEHTFGLKPSFCVVGEHSSQTNSNQSQSGNPRADTRLNYLGKFIDIFYQLPEPDRQEFVRMKLDKMPEMQKYCKKFSDAPYLKLGLVKVLTADVKLFGNKSLRELIQNLELFSVFLRMNDDLSFEEIFTAFLIIIGNNNRMLFSQNVSSHLQENVYRISNISGSIAVTANNSSFSLGNLGYQFHLNKPECVAHFWICLSMLHTERHLNETPALVELVSRLKSATVAGFAFGEGSPGFIPPMPLTAMDEVEKSLFKKLQLLDDFSQVIPSNNLEEPSTVIQNPAVYAGGAEFGKLS
ncbi:MAG: P-loop NTPase fold protein, partial [Desulfovibrio sp.]|uniref:P-loop NTPase fold protein n=1 Tax=Desulfovibrio sp. TaxID=885 RepID=UPI0039E64416